MSSHHVPSRSAMMVGVVLLGLVSVGCSAAPTATPTPEPTATPVDILSAFEGFVNEPTLAGRGVVSYTTTIGAEALGTERTEMSGTILFAGEDWSTDVTVSSSPETPTQVREMLVEGIKYRSVDSGHWVDYGEPAPTEEQGLPQLLRGIGEVEEVEEIDWSSVPCEVPGELATGRVFHLQPVRNIDLSSTMLAFGEATAMLFEQLPVESSLYVRPDGSPVCMEMGLEIASGVEGALSGAISGTMAVTAYEPTTITKPTDTWDRFVSEERGFSVGAPAFYQVEPAESADMPDQLVDGRGWITAIWPYRDFDQAIDPSELVDAVSADFAEQLGATPEDAGSVRVAGQDAQLLTLDWQSEDGDALTVLVAVIPHADRRGGFSISRPSRVPEVGNKSFVEFLQTFEFLSTRP